jgi:hypothetical protein
MSDKKTKGIWKVISASSMGTMIEWYDFYIFGSLAVVIIYKIFPTDNPTAAFLSTLATFAAGFRSTSVWSFFLRKIRRFNWKKIYLHGNIIVNGWSDFRNWMYSKL